MMRWGDMMFIEEECVPKFDIWLDLYTYVYFYFVCVKELVSVENGTNGKVVFQLPQLYRALKRGTQ